MQYHVKCLFEVSEDMVQILLMFKVIFTKDSEVEYMFCGASSSSESSLFFSNNVFSLWSKPVRYEFQHDFTWMIDEADGSSVVAEL